MRNALLALALVAIAATARAEDKPFVEALSIQGGATTLIPVATTSTAETDPFDLRRCGSVEALWIIAASATGTADVKAEYALSLDGVTYTTFATYTDLIASSATLFASPASPEGLNRVLMPVVPGRWIKFLLTGVGSNPADSVVRLLLACRGLVQ